VGAAGAQSNQWSRILSLSRSGRYVLFYSEATNLVAGDTNGVGDVFLRDRKLGKTTRVSIGAGGVQGNGPGNGGTISGSGRFVAFLSEATNMVAGDTNGFSDLFVRDRKLRTTTRVSVSSNGAQADHDAGNPSISADGRFVAFQSAASTLVAGDTNATWDIFVRDRRKRTTKRVSVSRTGGNANGSSEFPEISDDGSVVVFMSQASNLVRRDTNGRYDVFARDRRAGKTERLSRSAGGAGGNFESGSPAISANGRFVAFESSATNLVPRDTNGASDIFLVDRRLDRIRRVSVDGRRRQGLDSSMLPDLSADGRFVGFTSRANNLIPGDTNLVPDIFVRGPLR
jgi:Tol biopolymer transport system component